MSQLEYLQPAGQPTSKNFDVVELRVDVVVVGIFDIVAVEVVKVVDV